MMTRVQLRNLSHKLHRACVASTNATGLPRDGRGKWCRTVEEANVPTKIETDRKKGVYVVTTKRGKKEVHPLPQHGRSHLGIDPETGEIGCVLCR